MVDVVEPAKLSLPTSTQSHDTPEADALHVSPAPVTAKALFHIFISYLMAPYIFVGIFVSLATTALVVRPFFRRHLFAYLQWWQKLMMEFLTLTTGVNLSVSGLEHVDGLDNAIIVANHKSWLDPMVTVFALKPKLSFAFMVKEGLLRIPLAGRYMRWAGFIAISRRRGANERNAQRLEDATAGLQKGVSLLVFPEGTRVEGHRFARFKKGAFTIAQSTQAPVVPVVISGTGRLLPRRTPFARPGPVHVDILPPRPAPNAHDDPEVWSQQLRQDMAKRYRPQLPGPPLVEQPALLAEVLAEELSSSN